MISAEYIVGLIVVGAVSFFFWLYKGQIDKMDKVQISSEVMSKQIDNLERDVTLLAASIKDVKRDHDTTIAKLIDAINELNVTMASLKGLINGRFNNERN
jgi:hypothetical protein